MPLALYCNCGPVAGRRTDGVLPPAHWLGCNPESASDSDGTLMTRAVSVCRLRPMHRVRGIGRAGPCKQFFHLATPDGLVRRDVTTHALSTDGRTTLAWLVQTSSAT